MDTNILLVLAAVAAVAFGPQAAAKLPQAIAWIKGVLPALFAASPDGSKPKLSATTLLLIGVIVFLLVRSPGSPSPSPVPPAPVPVNDAPDMTAVFGGSPDSRVNALLIAEFLDAQADAIEYDHSTNQPRLATYGHVEDLRILSRDYLLEGGSINALYPQFGPVVASYLDSKLGKSPSVTLTSEHVRLWVEAYRNLANRCREAAN